MATEETSDAMLVDCPSCRRTLRLAPEMAGRSVRCPACKNVLVVPAAGSDGISTRPQPPRPAPSRERLPPPRSRQRSAATGPAITVLVLGLAALGLSALGFVMAWFPAVRLVGLVGAGFGLAVAVVGIVLAVVYRGGTLALPIIGGTGSLLALVLGIIMMVMAGRSSSSGDSDDKNTEAKKQDWGKRIDPGRDCAFAQSGDKGEVMTIRVPDTPHDLSAELGFGRMNAPRVLLDKEGDFSVKVKVCGALLPPPVGTVPGRTPYQAAGLLVYSDDNNYLRLEHGAMPAAPVRSVAAFEMRANGPISSRPWMDLPNGDAWLRLERRGNQVFGYFSSDGGRQWISLQPFTVQFPARVKVGVAVVNAAKQPLAVRFEEFSSGR